MLNSLHRCRPTFLGIGSLRCGSTWLYQVLKSHPDIRLSDRKEMYFFFNREMLQHDLDWYEAHFAPADGGEPKPVRGEISPGYGRLKAWQVDRIAKLLPDLQLVLTLRNPIERVWSQALLEFGYLAGKDVRKIRSIDFLRQVERARNRLSSDYCRTIQIWSKAFGRDALHIGLFDDLQEHPQAFINSVLRHIGAATPWTLPAKFMTKVHATSNLINSQREIPEVVRWYIAERLLEWTKRLNETLQGRVSNWVDEMQAIRGKTRMSWRILREVNRTIFAPPERIAYEAYHAALDVRFWLRWRELERRYNLAGAAATPQTTNS
jgi:Sulfotransferase family